MNKKAIITFLVIILAVCTASAQDKAKNVSLKCRDMVLTEALRQVERQSGYYKISYNHDELGKHKVTADIVKKSAPVAVDILLDGLPYESEVKGRLINVVKKEKYYLVDNNVFTAKGRVIDQHGEPLMGVTIKDKNGKTGGITDEYGRFSIIGVNDQTTLVFSYIGMKTLERRASRNLIEVILDDEGTMMKDVVVTGIFKKAKESYTGAVSQISSEELSLHKGQNLLQTLKTIDASMNFQVNNLAGSDPNNLPQINIRGNSSLPMSVQEFNESTGNAVNTPLIILDGFEISLEKLMDYNDEEIESINILKDAAATAIYGSRGSNGVIVVTTRQPEAGKLRINAEIGIDIEVPDLTSYDYLNA